MRIVKHSSQSVKWQQIVCSSSPKNILSIRHDALIYSTVLADVREIKMQSSSVIAPYVSEVPKNATIGATLGKFKFLEGPSKLLYQNILNSLFLVIYLDKWKITFDMSSRRSAVHLIYIV